MQFAYTDGLGALGGVLMVAKPRDVRPWEAKLRGLALMDLGPLGGQEEGFCTLTQKDLGPLDAK